MRSFNGMRQDATAPVPALTGRSTSMHNVNWKRRNWCAAGILVLYFLVNAIAIGFYHFATPIQVGRNRDAINEIILALCVALTIMFFVTAWFWARAKNWPGFVGAMAALGGSLVWMGCAAAAVAPYLNKIEMNQGNPTIPINNWLPILPWAAFTFTAIILKVLPVRKSQTAAAPVPNAA